MNTLGLLQSQLGFKLTLQETRSIHDSMNRPKIEFIAYIYILLYEGCSNMNASSFITFFTYMLRQNG